MYDLNGHLEDTWDVVSLACG